MLALHDSHAEKSTSSNQMAFCRETGVWPMFEIMWGSLVNSSAPGREPSLDWSSTPTVCSSCGRTWVMQWYGLNFGSSVGWSQWLQAFYTPYCLLLWYYMVAGLIWLQDLPGFQRGTVVWSRQYTAHFGFMLDSLFLAFLMNKSWFLPTAVFVSDPEKRVNCRPVSTNVCSKPAGCAICLQFGQLPLHRMGGSWWQWVWCW